MWRATASSTSTAPYGWGSGWPTLLAVTVVASTVFRNGSLFDGRRYRGRVGAVVVGDGLIARYPYRRRRSPAGAGEVDLDGGLLAPGFTDAHVHTVQGGLERIRCDLSGLHTRAAYLARWRRTPPVIPSDWVRAAAGRAAFPGGTPTAADLDSVVADRRCPAEP